MELRRMEITLLSASDLSNSNLLFKTKAYATAWISSDHKHRQRTPVDKDNGTDPTWNHVMQFYLDEATLEQGGLVLEIAIYADATFGDKKIGRVSIPLNDFLKPADSNNSATTSAQFVSYQVWKPSGKAKGVLDLSVKLSEKAEVKQQQQPQAVIGSYGTAKAEPITTYSTGSYGAAKEEPVNTYPVYPPAGSFSHAPSYPPPNSQYPRPPYTPQAGYPPPPPNYHRYPPNQGYPPQPYQDYPSAQQPSRENNQLGIGLGAGLIGGALGGLVVGNLISDATYDGGFDDGGFVGGFGDVGDFGGDF